MLNLVNKKSGTYMVGMFKFDRSVRSFQGLRLIFGFRVGKR